MKNSTTLITATLLGSLVVSSPTVTAAKTKAKKSAKPNVVIIFTDDQGFGDLGCFGSPNIKTPNIDKMADEGLKLTSFYVSASVSSASRAALLTGRLNIHNGVTGVFFPNATGMSTNEVTMAEALKGQGYTTACIGKWHLGDIDGNLPLDQGFDEYFGIPYSNDMYIGSTHTFAESIEWREGFDLAKAQEHQEIAKVKQNAIKKIRNFPPLFEGDEIVEFPCDQATTTRRYFDRAIEFIERCRSNKEPFFAYITPAMPHYPLFASEEFEGRSERGLYGDVVEEIDYNVGRLIDYLDKSKLSKNTIFIFASDNGPSLNYKELGGSAGPFRDGKFSIYEGGVRVPFVVKWDGVIPAGSSSDSIVASIDLFPTIMHYAGVDYSSLGIDGIESSSFFENPTKGLRDEYLYIFNGKILGIRKGDWAYLPYTGSKKNNRNTPELFNLKEDISQSNNIHDQFPEKVAELDALMQSYIDAEK
ncbi:MAG: sulfatase-like hydrolase/transferase [Rikenellaceae bacterium]